jgi:hypothetical protein
MPFTPKEEAERIPSPASSPLQAMFPRMVGFTEFKGK